MANDWLRVEIATGLQKLLALRLPGTPPEDAIVGTAEVWLEAIENSHVEWAAHLDVERVRRTFQTLYRICDRWPAPRLFLDNLGSRKPVASLPAPPLSAEERRRNKKRLEEIQATLKSHTLKGN